MCGCVWWAVGWAALQAAAVSSPSPRPDCPLSGRGRRAAGVFWGRWVAARGLPVRRHQGLTSWLVTGWDCLFFLFVFLCFRSPPVTHKEKEEGGLHLLHGRVCVCVWGWGDVQRGGLIGGGVAQQYPAIKGREREKERFLSQIKGWTTHRHTFCDFQMSFH